jgi:hypothetical protein
MQGLVIPLNICFPCLGERQDPRRLLQVRDRKAQDFKKKSPTCYSKYRKEKWNRGGYPSKYTAGLALEATRESSVYLISSSLTSKTNVELPGMPGIDLLP